MDESRGALCAGLCFGGCGVGCLGVCALDTVLPVADAIGATLANASLTTGSIGACTWIEG